jgi:hypothetical protein
LGSYHDDFVAAGGTGGILGLSASTRSFEIVHPSTAHTRAVEPPSEIWGFGFERSTALRISSDGQLAAFSTRRNTAVISLGVDSGGDGSPKVESLAFGASVSFSPDFKTMARVDSSGIVRVFSRHDGQYVETAKSYGSPATAIALLGDRSLFVEQSDPIGRSYRWLDPQDGAEMWNRSKQIGLPLSLGSEATLLGVLGERHLVYRHSLDTLLLIDTRRNERTFFKVESAFPSQISTEISVAGDRVLVTQTGSENNGDFDSTRRQLTVLALQDGRLVERASVHCEPIQDRANGRQHASLGGAQLSADGGELFVQIQSADLKWHYLQMKITE